MQLRTFLARDMKTALSDVRDQMGPDAVIIASEKAKGGGIIVRAALDTVPRPQTAPPPPPADITVPADLPVVDPDTNYRNALIRRLRGGGEPGATRRRFDRGELLAQFARHRVPDALAHALAEESAKTGLSDMTLALAAAVDARLVTAPILFPDSKAILLVGPNGAGKTAVAAKLAAHARLVGRPVMMVAADVSGAGAVARLKEFADHLDAGISTAENTIILTQLVEDAAAHGTLAIVDTAGFDPRQPKAASAFGALSGIENVEPIGVVSALGDSEEVAEIATALSQLGATRLIVTGIDLSRRAGALATAAMTPGQRLAAVTRSPYVAGGLETLSPLALARLLVESGSTQ